MGALIGWGTNYIALRMLFRPRRERKVLGLKLQGLIPARKRELARAIGQTVERELLSHQDLKRLLADPALLASLREELCQRVGDFLRKRFDDLPLPVLLFIPADMETKLKEKVAEEIIRSLPEIAGRLAEELERKVDLAEFVAARVEAFSPERLEAVVLAVARREMRWIELLGGLLGFLVGLLQLALYPLLGR